MTGRYPIGGRAACATALLNFLPLVCRRRDGPEQVESASTPKRERGQSWRQISGGASGNRAGRAEI